MCSPALGIGAAMMAASVVANKMGADQQQGARNQVLNDAETARENVQNQMSQKFNATLPLASRENADKNAADAAGVRAGRDQALIGSIGSKATPDGGAPADIGALFDSSQRDSKQRGAIQADANSKVGGIADANQKLAIDLGKAGEWQRIFAGNMANQTALVPGQLENANYAGSGARGAGQVLGAAGSAVTSYGMSGAGTTPQGDTAWGDLFNSGAPPTDGSMNMQPRGFFPKLFSK